MELCVQSDVWQMNGQTDPNPNTVVGESELASICWDEVTKLT